MSKFVYQRATAQDFNTSSVSNSDVKPHAVKGGSQTEQVNQIRMLC